MSDITQKTNSEGNTTFNVDLNTPGKYSAKAVFSGDTNYSSSESTIQSFKVPNIASTSEIITPSIVLTTSETDNIIYSGVPCTLTATVTHNNSGISGLTVYFVYVNNNGVVVDIGNSNTNSNGVATVSFTSSDLTDGSTWTLYAYTNATSEYNKGQSPNIVVTNKRVPTSLTLASSKYSLTGSGTVNLTATLSNSKGVSMSNRTIYIFNGSSLLTSGKTNTSGVFEAKNINISSTSYLQAVFEKPTNEGLNGATSNQITITVTSGSGGGSTTPIIKNTNLTVTSINNSSSLPVGSALNVSGKLVDSDNTPISGATVTLNITSTSDSSVNINVTGTTNSSGEVTLSRSVTGAGTFKAKLVYSGLSGSYYGSTSSEYTVVTYCPKCTSIGNMPTSSSLTNGSVIDPTLLDYQGNGIGGRDVNITLSNSSGSRNYTARSLASSGKLSGLNGSGTGLKLELSGTFSLTVTVTYTPASGDGAYDSCSVTKIYAYSG